MLPQHRPDVAPEIAILLCCARRQRSAAQTAQLQRLLSTGVDWTLLMQAAAQHGMLPLLNWHLKALPPEITNNAVPAPVLAQLRQHVYDNGVHYFRAGTELVNLLRHFDAHGIRALPFKGVALSTRLYGNAALRQPGDLDILIRSQEVRPAIDALAEFGYHTEFQGAHTQNQQQAVLRFGNELVFRNPEASTLVDLHWQLYPWWLHRSTDFDAMWARRETVEVAGTEVPIFGVADLLPYLCLHGSKHGWARLKWLCDVAEILYATPNLDWNQIKIQSQGQTSSLWLGLALAQDLLDAPVPASVAGKIAANPALGHMLEQARARLLSLHTGPETPALAALPGPLVTGVSRVFAHARVEPGSDSNLQHTTAAFDQSFDHLNLLYLERSDRSLWAVAIMWLRFALRPTPEVISSLSLPAPLFPLYGLLRFLYLLQQIIVGTTLALWSRLPVPRSCLRKLRLR